MLEFVLIGSAWFWIVFGVYVLAIMACEIYETGIMASVTTAIALGALHLTGFDVFQFIKDNPGDVLVYVALYVLVGIVWAAVKWYLFAVEKGKKYAEERAEFFLKRKEYKPKQTPEEIEEGWLDRTAMGDYPPKVQANKRMISRWIGCWVTSVIWTLLSDCLTAFFEKVTKIVSGAFQKLSDKAFAKYSK